jgi:simple sugar transport system permease protein
MKSENNNMEIIIIGIAKSAINLATPYLYASIGETIGQLSGVLNLGVEGVMLMGAFSAFYVVFKTGNLLLGLLVAIIVGGIFGVLIAFVNVTLKAKQGISGIGFYILGLGLSSFLFRTLIGRVYSVTGFPSLSIPWLSSIPVIGQILFQQNILVYCAFILVPLIWFIIHKTPLGLSIRAVGQYPQAADSLGVNVIRIRYFTQILSGILSAIAGATISISTLNVFQDNITSGIGFIAVALVYFGSWNPFRVTIGIFLFSFVNAIQIFLQVKGINIPSEFTSMMPYVVIIVMLAAIGKYAVKAPAALKKPFERE